VIAGEIGRCWACRCPGGLRILDPALDLEPDAEISDLLRASTGLNLACATCRAPSCIAALAARAAATLASAIVWFDAYTTNVDRTLRNPNILVWQGQLWLIDHGPRSIPARLRNYLERSRTPFPLVKDTLLLPFAADCPPLIIVAGRSSRPKRSTVVG